MPALPAISAYYRIAGNAAGPWPYQWLLIEAPLTLSFDGTSPHLSVTPPKFGFGFITASTPGQPQSIYLDTAYVSFRVDPPTGPGPCVDPISGIPYGTGVWAADAGFVYFAVPSPTGGFVWARTQLATTW